MIHEIFSNLIYLIQLTFKSEILWTIYPLAIATIITVVYFEKYKDENPGWNTHVANSLVLIFVSAATFKHFFSLNGQGLINITMFPLKFTISTITFVLGLVILFVNFEHILPEKISRKISSPITLNTIAYILILFVYSELPTSISLFISLLIIFIILILILNLLKAIFKKIFVKLKKMKDHEKIDNLKEKKEEIVCKKNDLKCIERKIRMQELEKIKKQKKELKKIEKISRKI
ncbi:MAG: hypothetical protein PVJ67_06475 [Candidatus Pacearchaeota archaeon]|jgi:hypothetical protein